MRKIALVAVAVVVAGLFVWRTAEALRLRQAQTEQAAVPRQGRRLPVQVAPASRTTLVVRANYTGEVTARSRVEVFSRIPGIVADLPVREGDAVRRGQVVARLDPKELRFQAEQARAGVATQRVQVEQARANLNIQRARLDQVLSGSASEQVRQAEEQVRQARASLEFSRAQLRRQEELFNQGFVSRQAVDTARLEVTLQETRLRTAEEQLKMLQRGPRPEEVAVARAQVEQADASHRQAQSTLAQSQVTLRQTQSMLAESTVRAPADGIVSRRLVDTGATVATSTPLMEIVDVDPAVITIPVIERELAQMRAGTPAQVRTDAVPGQTFQGRVASISPVLSTATRTAEVKIEVANPRGLLRPGMFARADLVLARRESVVAIPVESLLERDNGQVIFIVVDESARARQVDVGISDGTRIEVTRGVLPGERVVVSGQHALRDGSEVIIPEQRRPGGGRPGGPPAPSPGGGNR